MTIFIFWGKLDVILLPQSLIKSILYHEENSFAFLVAGRWWKLSPIWNDVERRFAVVSDNEIDSAVAVGDAFVYAHVECHWIFHVAFMRLIAVDNQIVKKYECVVIYCLTASFFLVMPCNLQLWRYVYIRDILTADSKPLHRCPKIQTPQKTEHEKYTSVLTLTI